MKTRKDLLLPLLLPRNEALSIYAARIKMISTVAFYSVLVGLLCVSAASLHNLSHAGLVRTVMCTITMTVFGMAIGHFTFVLRRSSYQLRQQREEIARFTTMLEQQLRAENLQLPDIADASPPTLRFAKRPLVQTQRLHFQQEESRLVSRIVVALREGQKFHHQTAVSLAGAEQSMHRAGI